MGSKKTKIRCWVCGAPATEQIAGEDVCYNRVCHQITHEHIEFTIAELKLEEKRKKYREGEYV
jgi:hypothetical protein